MAPFRLELSERGRADVYLASDVWDGDIALVVRRMDEAGIRVVGDISGVARDDQCISRILRGCSGIICDRHLTDTLLRLSSDAETPVLERHNLGFSLNSSALGSSSCIDDFVSAVLHGPVRIREYAFYIGRLESDFAHAREAIRCALENEAGIPLLWIDDSRHRTNGEGIRERTRLLLEHASFVVADLTLGVESPDRENPSRAHEIGLSMAYNRLLLLLSQEPRRYTYFSINDLQTTFWSTEADLYMKVREWAKLFQDKLGRATWNYRLLEQGYQPRIGPLAFCYAPEQRYIGPKTPRQPRPYRAVATSAAVVLILFIVGVFLVIRTR